MAENTPASLQRARQTLSLLNPLARFPRNPIQRVQMLNPDGGKTIQVLRATY